MQVEYFGDVELKGTKDLSKFRSEIYGKSGCGHDLKETCNVCKVHILNLQ